MDGYEFDLAFSRGNNPEELAGFIDFISFPSETYPLIIAGVDEVGRGPLAGPVVASAVILPLTPQIEGLNDSKKIPENKRDDLFEKIKEVALSIGIAVVSARVIDQINILQASLQAMREALEQLATHPHIVLVDGNQKPKSRFVECSVIKGDAKSAAVMAASIVAKVTRDRLMKDLHEAYPHYGFDSHKGYASKKHRSAIDQHGPCPEHRMSFEPLLSLARREEELIF